MSSAHTESSVCYLLPKIKIDPKQLVDDFNNVIERNWASQDRYKAGMTNWKGVCLYSISGKDDDLRCSDRPNVKKTSAGDLCPYICNEILPQFGAPWFRVAFYLLDAGTRIGEHRDYGQNRTMGMVRIHIPIVTNQKVVMYLEGQPYRFAVGEAWYFDASCRHRVENNGTEDRIHLIADFMPTKDLAQHLKPIIFKDHVRFLKHRFQHYGKVITTFCKFVQTPEGRRRIRTRLRLVLGGF